LGRRINTLCSHLKNFLSRNLDQNKLKNAVFVFGKAVNNVLGASLEE